MDWTTMLSTFWQRSRSQSSSSRTRIFVDELDEVGFTLNNNSEHFDTADLSDDSGYSDEEVDYFNDDSEINRIQYDDDDDDVDDDESVSLSIVMSDIFDALARYPGNTDASKTWMGAVGVLKIDAKHVDEELNCAVCKDRFELDCEAKELPCKHLFHAECILPWLKYRNNTCPLCRYELPTEENTSNCSPSIDSINDD